MKEQSGGLKFDGTINWPFLLAIAGAAASFFYTSAVASNKIEVATTSIGEIRQDVKVMAADISTIKGGQLIIPELRRRDDDFENRIRKLEEAERSHGR